MPNVNASQVAQMLHDNKIINLDTSLRDTLATQPALAAHLGDAAADWNLVVGNHYVIVTGLPQKGGLATNPGQIQARS